MKTSQILEAYKALNPAKLTKMEDTEKFLVIRAMKQMKPVVRSFEDFQRDAAEKLKADNHDEMVRKLQQWQQDGDKTTLTLEERVAVNRYINAYSDRINRCLGEEQEREHPLDFTPLSEEAFARLAASNDFEVSTLMVLEEVLCGGGETEKPETENK